LGGCAAEGEDSEEERENPPESLFSCRAGKSVLCVCVCV
jgi:hypothetical protein